jgi:hypothetical protein
MPRTNATCWALERIDEAASTAWMRAALMHSVREALGRLLDELGDKRLAMVRGDSGYGNEGMRLELEGRGQPYLLRLRQAANVQRRVDGKQLRLDLAGPSARMEAITSRSLLAAAVGKAANQAGQTTLYLTPIHGKTSSYLVGQDGIG